MRGNSDKMGMSFQLPPLELDTKPYEELVFQQNKFIVYTNQPNKKSFSKISTPKTSNYHSRPNTTATFNTRLNQKNQLSRNRYQQSIDRFIQTHKKINSIRYEPVNQLKKIKSYKSWNNNNQSFNQNKLFAKGKQENSQFSQNQILDFQQIKSNGFIQQTSPYVSPAGMGPEQRLITQIKMSRHSRNSLQKERNKNKLMSSIKSLGKLQTERSLDVEKMNTVVPLVIENQKASLEIKARNHFPLRKSLSMTPVETDKFEKNSKPMPKDLQNKQEQCKNRSPRKQQTKKQPEIKQQNYPQFNQHNSEDVFETKQNRSDDNKDSEGIDQLLEPQYFLKMTFQTHSIEYYSAEDTQVKSIKLKNKQKLQHVDKPQMQPIIVEEKLPIKEDILINQSIPRLDFKPATYTQNSEQLLQGEKSPYILNPNDRSSTIEKKSISKSPFLKQKSSKSNNQFLSRSKVNQISQFKLIDGNNFKRAPIIEYLNQKYYQSRIDLYQKIVSQQKNAYLSKIQRENSYQTNNFGYSKNTIKSQLNENPSQLPLDSNIRNQIKQFVYVDPQFPHQDVSIPQNITPVNWLYFAPCPNSSLFPKLLKLPEHYVQTSMKRPLPLIRLLNCLLTVNPKIIQRLFEPVYNNVFSVWLNINGTFEPIFVDGYLPYDSSLNSLYGHSEEFLWIAVLIKAAAKSFGGYQALQRLSFDQWCRVIVGFSLETLPKPEYEEIKEWGEQGFEQRIQEYLKRGQLMHQSYIIIHKQQTHNLSIIKSIHNNKIKLMDCDQSITKHEISLFELLIDKSYTLLLVPQSKQFYHRSGEFAGYSQGNIVSYQLRVYEHESWVNLRMGLRNYLQGSVQDSVSNAVLLRRRLLIYEIPVNFHKPNNKKEMTLVHGIDNFAQLKSQRKIQKYTLLETHLPQLKKGQYKIFIECGNIDQFNPYIEFDQQNINRRIKSEGSYFFEDYMTTPRRWNNNQKSIINNGIYGNFITFTSNNRIETSGSQYLNSLPKEPIQDQNYKYFSPKVNHTMESFYY